MKHYVYVFLFVWKGFDEKFDEVSAMFYIFVDTAFLLCGTE